MTSHDITSVIKVRQLAVHSYLQTAERITQLSPDPYQQQNAVIEEPPVILEATAGGEE